MAKYRGEEKSGKVGKVIYSSWHGRPYQRSMPESVANPRTEAQQAHRNAFAAISKLSSDLKEAHLIGLHKMAQKEQLDTYSVFKKINKSCYIGSAISYPHVIVSKGPVDEVEITSVKVDEKRVLHVTFDGGVTEKNSEDLFGLFVYCPELRKCHAAELLQCVIDPAGAFSKSCPKAVQRPALPVSLSVFSDFAIRSSSSRSACSFFRSRSACAAFRIASCSRAFFGSVLKSQNSSSEARNRTIV